MRIISKFHDFYDSVQKTGQDLELLYIRKQEKLDLSLSWPFPKCKAADYYDTYIIAPSVHAYIVGFCGKIYPVIHIYATAQQKAYCFKLEDVDHFVESTYKQKYVEEYLGKKFKRNCSWPFYKRRINFKEFFEEVNSKKDKFASFFLQHMCPIFIAREGEVTLNGCLKDIEFYKIMEPYTAFQELQMYIGGLAHPDKPIPHVSDKDLMEGKGFDSKWSFRKPPSK